MCNEILVERYVHEKFRVYTVLDQGTWVTYTLVIDMMTVTSLLITFYGPAVDVILLDDLIVRQLSSRNLVRTLVDV